jgi:prolyl-tRNA synthetase
MRWSKTLIPTLRQAPSEAVVPSHQLMLRAGFIQQVASGSYTYLPMGCRVLAKVMNIVREEMNRAGAVEVFMPALQPVEWWEQTGRREAYGENLFVLKDRHGREQALGPTHEEVTTKLIDAYVESYRQLPITVYQIQTKFRDEFRPRFGVLRSREFQMKDAYSFDIDLDGLNESYDKMFAAYCRIFERCGLPYVTVEAESGPVGGSASHEFMVPSPTGEDTILSSDKGNYAANVEKCETGPREHDLEGEPTGDLEDLHTPGCPGIDDVIAYCKKELKTKIKPENMLKCLVYVATAQDDVDAANPWYVLAVVRSDHDVNEAKVREVMGRQLGEGVNLIMAPEDLAREDGWAIGYVGPHGANQRDDTYLLIDPDAAQPGFWVTGGNEPDHHVKHFNWKREVIDGMSDDAKSRMQIADIRNAVAGDPSPKNDGGVLVESKGIEIGHVFKLGTKYTDALNVTVLDENQQARPIIMGCYGIGVNRIMASAIETVTDTFRGHDDNGIIWPTSIAPYQVVITPIKFEGRAAEVANMLYGELEDRGVDVLLDDRDERPGVKFKDADLIGIPLRIVIGEKGLANGEVEFKPRTADKAENVKVDQVIDRAVAFLSN